MRSVPEQGDLALCQAPAMVGVACDEARRTYHSEGSTDGFGRREVRDEHQPWNSHNRPTATKNAERETNHGAQQ